MKLSRVLAGVAAVIFAVAIAACGGDDGTDEGGEETTAAAEPCTPVQEIDVPKAANYHQGGKFTADDYETNPPAGGFHSLGLLGPPVIKPPLDDLGPAVHELNHGAVILWPGKGMSSKDDQTLLKTYRSLEAKDGLNPGDKYAQLAIIGNPSQEATFAMSAWGYLQECDSVDADAIEAFVEEYYASGPEGQNVACGGIAGISKPPDVPACQKGQ